MTKIALRAYTREIEGLIEHAQRIDEAIAHCRRILETYPKHLETYRLLGKAYLEGKRYSQAVDIFERLLVAVPDDFVAHVGMSIIADDQGSLDDAIWHMERAFEVQPSNPAIQAELQRLYGRRDGAEPPKIRLTRGALARMYVQGQLYSQAIGEIRAVLGQDPSRADLQVLLAKAYLQSGQKTEAADVCAKLLSDYAYCFEANRLMVELLAGTASAESAQEYRQRVNELDPYAALAHGSVLAADTVPDAAVSIERLEYAGQAPEVGLYLGSGLQEPAAAPRSSMFAQQTTGDEIPPFLRETDAGVAAAAAVTEHPGEEAAEPAAPSDELPAWVRALEPVEPEGTEEELEAEMPGSLPWLGAEEASAEGTSGIEGVRDLQSETPAWLRDLPRKAEGREGEIEPWEIGEAGSPVQASPTAEVEHAGPPEEENGLAWLESLAAKQGVRPEAQPPMDTASAGEPPAPGAQAPGVPQPSRDALDSTAFEPSKPPETPSDTLPHPGVSGETQWEAGEPTAGGRATATAESPEDWLRELAAQGTYAEDTEASPAELGPSAAAGTVPQWLGVTAPPRVGEEPAWLGGAVPSAGVEEPATPSAPSGEHEPEASLPDWLTGLDKERGVAPSVTPSEEPPSWLESEGGTGLATPIPSTPKDWRAAETITPSEPQPEFPVPTPEEAREFAETPPESASVSSLAGALPKIARQAGVTLGSAQLELGRGNIAAALEIYEKLIHKGKSLVEIIRDLREALHRYPVEVPIWQALGDAYMRANRLQEALDAYTKAEELLR